MIDVPREPPQTVAETVRSTPRCDTGGLHDEMVLYEILVRLPARSVYRCRAVCRSWRCLTSDPAFLLAHHRRQPALPLIYFCRGNCIGAIDLQAGQLRPVARHTPLGYRTHVNASCDGLLVLSSPGDFYICNPATNQWAAVPQLLDVDFMVLYPHHPSGEYRLLYGAFWRDVKSVYYIVTVGSGEPRRITMTLGSEPAEEQLAREFLMRAHGRHSVLVRGNLHWYLRERTDSHEIIVFDAVAESFHWMRPPVVPGWVDLFEMDGTLGMSAVKPMATGIDLWVLQDYERNVWAFKYRVELPMAQIRQFPEGGVKHADSFPTVVSGDGDVMVRYSNRIFHCDRKGNLLVTFQFDGCLPMECSHRLKESLVLHAFFQMQHNNGVGLPPLF